MERFFFLPYTLLFLVATAVASAGSLIFKETFDGDTTSEFATRLLQHRHISLVESGGPDGSNAIRVAYVGYDLGSERVVLHYPLDTSLQQATLVFDVLFEEGFQWTMGGKLHGLGPMRPRTGRDTPREDGWSARIMFNPHGVAATYLADQETAARAGFGNKSQPDVFQPGMWHRVVLQISLNDVESHNGFVYLWVDGRNVASTKNRAFRATEQPEANIQSLMFSTFHGGGSPRYAPVDQYGQYTTVYARFDNFRVYDGIVPATNESFPTLPKR